MYRFDTAELRTQNLELRTENLELRSKIFLISGFRVEKIYFNKDTTCCNNGLYSVEQHYYQAT
ncbi:hypothetical protein NIES4073_08960 [Kalymmatonema gypsitolerans NIES-4073]|nr:hypothetical protein NIES4073_08960 [Scytonema sp. NIES-4073]